MNTFRSRLTRRSFVTAAAAASSLLSTTKSTAETRALSSEVPDLAIGDLDIGSPTNIPDNFGDTWIAAWGKDGHLYTASNDTSGFGFLERALKAMPDLTAEQRAALRADLPNVFKVPTAEQQRAVNPLFSTIAFNRLTGDDPLTLRGDTLTLMPEFHRIDRLKELASENGEKKKVGADGGTWKSSGCSSIDGVLYWVVARHTYGEDSSDPRLRQTAENASIIKSTDFGRTWTRSGEENIAKPMFPGSNFATPYFIEYGRSPLAVDGADRYVYAISNNGFWDNGDTFVLGRVLRDRIGLLNGADWEFFVGGDGAGRASWIRNPERAVPILRNPGKLGMSGAVYLPARRRYLLISWYYPAGSGKIDGASTKTVWDFYEAPKPWGPWTQIKSHTWNPQGYYCPAICPKFQSADRVYVLTSGDFRNWDYYRLTIVPIDIKTAS